jgi:hypothetical protein
MFYVWILALGTFVILAVTALSIFLALTRDLVEVEFRAVPPTIRVSGRGRR